MNEQGTTMLVLPAKFAADHFDRCGLEQEEGGHATILRRGQATWTARLNQAAINNLRSDAAYYSHDDGPDLQPAGLKDSARRTLAALQRQAGAQ